MAIAGGTSSVQVLRFDLPAIAKPRNVNKYFKVSKNDKLNEDYSADQ
ncbi:hypothetical protein [Chryseobacterium sp. Leaf201]|nr:hypothetical protein [Chryseobacterium sp. Leaf201]